MSYTPDQMKRYGRIRLGIILAPVALMSLFLLIGQCVPGDEDPQPIGMGTFAFAIPAGNPARAPDSKARDACTHRDFCTVIGFAKGAPLPADMPLTEDQAARIIFQFTKSSGDPAGRSLWNCARFPDAPKPACLDSH